MISCDVETSGVDHCHGARAFLVTTCNEQQEVKYWEWFMDPVIRQPIIPDGDLAEIEETILSADSIVGQNIGFDVAALREIGVLKDRWPWDRTYDTTLAAHLLQSNYPKDLTTLARRYLGVRIDRYEEATRECVLDARRMVSSDSDTFPGWRIAKKGMPELPSAWSSGKDKGTRLWKADLWLPRAVAKRLGYSKRHDWWTVTSDYANTDSSVTLPLFQVMEKLIKERGLWNIYLERLKLLPIVYSMQERGITLNSDWLDTLEKRFIQESSEAGDACRAIAETFDYELELPKNGNNKSLTTFIFHKEYLGLPTVTKSKKTGNPSLDKTAFDKYEMTLPEKSKARAFIKSLKGKRRRDTALSYLDGYRRFILPIEDEWYKLHPSVNPVGTDTLRWSSQNPNEQNWSKQDGFNLRACLGPRPGREWWSLDYDNIELRIPAYESGEKILIEVFEKPNEPPYFGSNHLVNASIIYPDLFWPLADQKDAFKNQYKSTWYQWCKNFGFACQYSAQESSGTADRAAHKVGAQRMVKDRLKEHTRLNQHWVDFANKHGYVETLPDIEVDPEHGYPLFCTVSDSGGVKPTVPLSFHVQGTACWVMCCAMVETQEYLGELNRSTNGDYAIIMNVHDEIVLDFPFKPNKGNLPKVRKVASIMQRMGDRISVPLTVGISYHPNNWAEHE